MPMHSSSEILKNAVAAAKETMQSLVDLDAQANSTSSFGLQGVEQISLYDPLLGEASITEKIFPTRRDGLFIVPADLDLAGAEVEIARMPNHLTRCRIENFPVTRGRGGVRAPAYPQRQALERGQVHGFSSSRGCDVRRGAYTASCKRAT